MSQQNISLKLESIDSPFSKAVNFYLKHPEHNPLTDEEKELAIAAMGHLKSLDHSWTAQKYMTNYMSNVSYSDYNDIAFNHLQNVPRLFHDVTHPAESLGSDPKEE